MEIERRIKYATDVATMQRDIHHIQQAMTQQNVIIHAQTEQIFNLNQTLIAVNRTLSEATGGWKMLMLAGTVGAGLTAMIVSIYKVLKGV